MQTILLALLPISFLIFLGYFFKKIEFPSTEFWQHCDKFTYYVLFPSLLLNKLSTSSSSDNLDWITFVLPTISSLIIITLLLMLLSKFMFLFEGKAFTSIYQGAIRFNTYLFLALVNDLFNSKAMVFSALLLTVAIPIINLLCITIFSIYVPDNKITALSFIKSVLKNPLIIACLVGGALHYFEITLFAPLEKFFNILGSAALPLGLLSVGVGLHIKHIKKVKIELFTSLFIKLVLFPTIIFFISNNLGIRGQELVILVLFGAMPTAASSYILARQLRGDLKLMSSIVTIETLVSIFSISAILMLFQNYF